MTRLQGKRLAFLGVFLALAMIFSYLEHLLPIPMPIPGFKLGLCNVIVLFVAYRMGLFDGAVLSLARVLLSALLFGNPTGFFFSLFGALNALAKFMIGVFSAVVVCAMTMICVNTNTIQQKSLRLRNLEEKREELMEQNEEIERRIANAKSEETIRQYAESQGMVPRAN